jgi:CheY-like chemotaxis protein
VRLPLADGYTDELHDTNGNASEDQISNSGSHKQWDILCIEDNPANLRLIERILSRRHDIRLLTAVAPGLGLELAQAQQPALILLDINLPDMDGYAVMQCLRESEVTRDIPVVAISANAMPKDLARGKAAGFKDYLTKPIEVERLLAVVDTVIGTISPPVLPAQGDAHVA